MKDGLIKVVKKNEKRDASAFKSAWLSIVSFVKKIKNYFLSPPSYEQATLSGQGIAVVTAIDNGFKKHWKMLIGGVKTKTAKKVPEVIEEPDMDMSEVQKVMNNNKL
jgi:uncharacterized protein YegL